MSIVFTISIIYMTKTWHQSKGLTVDTAENQQGHPVGDLIISKAIFIGFVLSWWRFEDIKII